MKKILLFTLLLTSLYSDSKIYVGTSYGAYDEQFTGTLDAQSSSETVNIKVGYGDRKAYAVEFSVNRSETESKIFSNNDGIKYSINIELIKAFDFGIYINPFIKAGFGAGSMKIERELQNRLAFGSFNLGFGTFIPINDYFDLELGYNYKQISYETITYISQRISYESDVNTVYAGFNVRF